MGGVPSEERFQNLTTEQWLILINHYYNKKKRTQEEMLQGLEYIALLISFDPKSVLKVITQRRKKQAMEDNEQDKEKYFKVNQEGQNEFGQHVNTTFFDSLKEFGGEEALKAFGEEAIDYKMAPEMDEEDDFIKQAKAIAKEYEDQIIPNTREDTIIY